MTFGERLRDLRTNAGFSQADLTKRSGVPKTMLSRYENDHILPSISTLGRLADALEVHASVLLGNGAAISHAFSEELRARGIVVDDPEEAKQLAGLVADMLERNDARVSFLGPARSEESG
jgi:transcriptional regulator with XRE-family HTH domain